MVELPVGGQQPVKDDPNDSDRLANITEGRIGLLQPGQFFPQHLSDARSGVRLFHWPAVVGNRFEPGIQITEHAPRGDISRPR